MPRTRRTVHASFGTMSRRWLFSLGFASLSFSGCLLSTPVHEAPELSAITGPSEIRRSGMNLFTVTTTAATIEWGTLEGQCPVELGALERSALGQTLQTNSLTFSLSTNNIGPVCLWSLATDRDNAQNLVWKDINVTNGAPVAQVSTGTPALSPALPFDLYSLIRLSSTGSTDPDSDDLASYKWSITPEAGQAIVATPCSMPTNGSELCFMPPAPGKYTIALVVTDALGTASVPGTLDIRIASDRPPCLRDTEQSAMGAKILLRRWDEDVALAVAVDDDGDPFPPREKQQSKVAFTWFFRKLTPGKDASFAPLTNYSQATFRMAGASFLQGDEVQVRVEVSDRTGLAVQCPLSDDLCETQITSGCTQRLTWKVRYWL